MKYICVVGAAVLSYMISLDAAHMRSTPQEISQKEQDRQKARMWDALQRNDVLAVRALLREGIAPDISMIRGSYTPLQYTIEFHRRHMAEALIEAGADVNATDSAGWTPLMRAASKGPQEIVRVLLAAHANVNLQNPQGLTALMIAAANNKPDIVRALIDADADVNLKDKQGKTALQLAQEHGHGPAIEKVMKDALAARAQRVKKTEEQVIEHTGLIGDLAHIVAESVHGEGQKS